MRSRPKRPGSRDRPGRPAVAAEAPHRGSPERRPQAGPRARPRLPPPRQPAAPAAGVRFARVPGAVAVASARVFTQAARSPDSRGRRVFLPDRKVLTRDSAWTITTCEREKGSRQNLEFPPRDTLSLRPFRP